MDRIAGANMWEVGGNMDYGDRRETFSSIFAVFMLPLLQGWGYFFVITNRLNKQILLQTNLCIIKVKTTFWLSQQEN